MQQDQRALRRLEKDATTAWIYLHAARSHRAALRKRRVTFTVGLAPGSHAGSMRTQASLACKPSSKAEAYSIGPTDSKIAKTIITIFD